MKWILLVSLFLLTGCGELPLSSYDKGCEIIAFHRGWKEVLNHARDKHQVPPGLVMSVIFHESSFNATARPKRDRVLGFIPWRRSTAYGYGQIKDETWDWYKSRNPGFFQSRTHFSDTVDFIGWYFSVFRQQTDKKIFGTYDIGKHFYLSYHEGLGGYQRHTYEKNRWLLAKARKVSERAMMYDRQLKACL